MLTVKSLPQIIFLFLFGRLYKLHMISTDMVIVMALLKEKELLCAFMVVKLKSFILLIAHTMNLLTYKVKINRLAHGFIAVGS